MNKQLFAYSNFIQGYKLEAFSEIENRYPAQSKEAGRDLKDFLKSQAGVISRWRVALITRLITADELTRLGNKLILLFVPQSLKAKYSRTVDLQEFRKLMVNLLLNCMKANAEAVCDGGAPETMRLRL